MMQERVTIGPLAFFILLAAGFATVFHIVDFSDSQTVQIALFMILSIALMGIMRPQLRLNVGLQQQMYVLIAGLYGAAGLILSQLLISSVHYSSINAALYAAIAEEAFFSGFAYVGLRRILPTINWSVIASVLGLAFASLHVIVYQLNIVTILILLVGRVILFWSLESTSDLGAPLIGHVLVNFLATGADMTVALEALRFVFPLVIFLIIVWWVVGKR